MNVALLVHRRRVPGRWALALAVLAGGCLGVWPPLSRAQAALSEPELKAALVFNFARYIEWPERAFSANDAPLSMCVVARDTLAGAFVALEGRKLQGRLLRVRRNVTQDDAQQCHVLFVAEGEDRRLLGLLRSLARQPVLTVGDGEGFIDSGGAIGIVPGEQRLQFEINRSALDLAQLKASSQLLKLARAVLNAGG